MDLNRLANEGRIAARPSTASAFGSGLSDTMPPKLGSEGLHSWDGRAQKPMILDQEDGGFTAQRGLQDLARASHIEGDHLVVSGSVNMAAFKNSRFRTLLQRPRSDRPTAVNP